MRHYIISTLNPTNQYLKLHRLYFSNYATILHISWNFPYFVTAWTHLHQSLISHSTLQFYTRQLHTIVLGVFACFIKITTSPWGSILTSCWNCFSRVWSIVCGKAEVLKGWFVWVYQEWENKRVLLWERSAEQMVWKFCVEKMVFDEEAYQQSGIAWH